MSSLIPFSFESHSIRAFSIDGNPWFVGKDVAEAIGFKDTVNAIKLHCRGVAKYHPLPTPGGTQEVRIINEPDTFRLITNSTLPAAERFEAWLFEEVLPAIRKTGGYALPGAQPAQTDIAALAQQLADLLKGKVVVDYDSLCRFARMSHAAAKRLVEIEKLLGETERVGLELEKQCGHPLVRLDIPPERLARRQALDREQGGGGASSFCERIARFVAGKARVCVGQIAAEVFGEKPDRALEIRIGHAMKALGWQRRRECEDGKRGYVYERAKP